MSMLRSRLLYQYQILQRTSQRTFASEAKDATPVVVNTTKTSKGSTLTGRITSFFIGMGIGSSIGLYQLITDIDKSTQEMQKQIKILQQEIESHNTSILKRLEHLERDH